MGGKEGKKRGNGDFVRDPKVGDSEHGASKARISHLHIKSHHSKHDGYLYIKTFIKHNISSN